MPARRLLVRKIRDVLRLKHEQGLSHRAIARACAVGVGTVTLYLQRTVQEGLGWSLPAELDDAAARTLGNSDSLAMIDGSRHGRLVDAARRTRR